MHAENPNVHARAVSTHTHRYQGMRATRVCSPHRAHSIRAECLEPRSINIFICASSVCWHAAAAERTRREQRTLLYNAQHLCSVLCARRGVRRELVCVRMCVRLWDRRGDDACGERTRAQHSRGDNRGGCVIFSSVHDRQRENIFPWKRLCMFDGSVYICGVLASVFCSLL